METTDPARARIALKLEALATFDALFAEALAWRQSPPGASAQPKALAAVG